MSEKTHAEIIAEMRFHGQQNVDAEKDKPEYGILTYEGRLHKNFADELDAAHKRELDELRKRIGDTAKVREALLATLDMIFEIQNNNRSPLSKIVYAVRRKVKAALAGSPRNCDKYTTVKDAAIAFAKAKNNLPHPIPDFIFSAWLLDTTTESEVSK